MEGTYIWYGNRIRGSLFTEITDHVLDEDRPLGNFAIDSDISAIGTLESQSAGHLGRDRDVVGRGGLDGRGL